MRLSALPELRERLLRHLIPTRGLADSLGFPRAGESESMVANGRFAMRRGLTLRGDYDAARLRGLARRTKSAAQGRRLLALAEIYDAGSRTKAACVGGVGLQTIRDWGLRFNAHGPEGLRGPPGTGPSRQVEHRATRGSGGDGRERSDPCDPRHRTLAAERPGDVGLGGVPGLCERDDGEPDSARSRLPQALGPPPPSCPGCGSGRLF